MMMSSAVPDTPGGDPIVVSLTVMEDEQVPIHIQHMFLTLTPLALQLRAPQSDFTVTVYFEDILGLTCVHELGQIVAITGSLQSGTVTARGAHREYILLTKDTLLSRQLAEVMEYKVVEHRTWKEQRRMKQLATTARADGIVPRGISPPPRGYNTGLLVTPARDRSIDTVSPPPRKVADVAVETADSVTEYHPIQARPLTADESRVWQSEKLVVGPSLSHATDKKRSSFASPAAEPTPSSSASSFAAAAAPSALSVPRTPAWLLARKMSELTRHDAQLHPSAPMTSPTVGTLDEERTSIATEASRSYRPPGSQHAFSAWESLKPHDQRGPSDARVSPVRSVAIGVTSAPRHSPPRSVFMFSEPPPFMFAKGETAYISPATPTAAEAAPTNSTPPPAVPRGDTTVATAAVPPAARARPQQSSSPAASQPGAETPPSVPSTAPKVQSSAAATTTATTAAVPSKSPPPPPSPTTAATTGTGHTATTPAEAPKRAPASKPRQASPTHRATSQAATGNPVTPKPREDPTLTPPAAPTTPSPATTPSASAIPPPPGSQLQQQRDNGPIPTNRPPPPPGYVGKRPAAKKAL